MNAPPTGLQERIREYFALPLTGLAAKRDYARLLLLTSAAMATAVLLVHTFAPAGLSRLELFIHAATLILSFFLAIAVAGWLLLRPLTRKGRGPTVGHLWLISLTGFMLGILVSGLFEGTETLSRIATKAAGLHGPGSMLPRLVPVWFILTVFIVRTQVLRTYEQQFEGLQPGTSPQNTSQGYEELVIRSGAETYRFRLTDIVRVRAEENYCRFDLNARNEPDSILVRATFKSVLADLPEGVFIQVHRSHAVNRSYVQRFARVGRHFKVLLTVKSGSVPVSRRRIKGVLEQLSQPV